MPANSAKQYKFMQTLISQPEFKMEKTRMLQRNWGNFDIHDLGKIVETLVSAEIITAAPVGSKIYYTLTDKATGIYLSGKEN